MDVILRNATIEDLSVLNEWDNDEDVGYSGGDDDSYEWEYELPRQVSWREILIAEIESRPIGAVVLIDARREESHYWGDAVEDGAWAIDIWIGAAKHRSLGYGAQMMAIAIERCFNDHAATKVLIDPLQSNHGAIRFYKQLGFTEVGPRRFGNDDCLVLALSR